MMNNFRPTGKLVLTENGLQPVYTNGTFLYIKDNTDGFVIYELICKDSVITEEEAKEKYPEEMI